MKILDEMIDANMDDAVSIFENELDTLGTNSSLEKYVSMLEKAPPAAPSLAVLVNFIQDRFSTNTLQAK